MTDETTTTKKALSPIEVGAGAGAAVLTAFASSYLGTAGTLTGAAIASVVGTVSTSVLRNSAQTSAQRLKQTTTRLRDTRIEHARVTDVRPVESEDVDPYGTQFFDASDWIDPDGSTERRGLLGPTGADPGSTWDTAGPDPTRTAGSPAGKPLNPGNPGPTTGSTRTGSGGPRSGATRPVTRYAGPELAGLGVVGSDRSGESDERAGVAEALRRVRGRWVVVGAGAVAAFALALGAITGIEAAAGKPLSGLSGQESGGGTTIGRATGADSGSGSRPSPTPTPTTSAGSTPTAPPSRTARSASPTEPSSPPASNPAPPPSEQAPTQAPTPVPGVPTP